MTLSLPMRRRATNNRRISVLAIVMEVKGLCSKYIYHLIMCVFLEVEKYDEGGPILFPYRG